MVEDRKTLNGIMYVLRSGCPWQGVPKVLFAKWCLCGQ